jgi:HlyD family secretion protein
MDSVVGRRRWSWRRWALIALAAALVGGAAWSLLRHRGTRLVVDASRLTTAVVRRGEFLEYYPFDGTVEPATQVYLDVESGGRVEQIFVEAGQHVEKGDPILRFANTEFRRTAIDTETQLLYNLDIQRTTVFNSEQSSLLLQDALLDLDHQIEELQHKFQRYDALMKTASPPISVETFEITRDQLKYLKDKRALLAERIRQEEELSRQQLAQARHSIERLNTGLGLLSQIVDSLEVRAPTSGWLSSIDVKLGQNIPAGARIGQIDLLDRFKVHVQIDQYYINRVSVGTPGHITLDDRTWTVTVRKIYPEVTQNLFAADAEFVGPVPPDLKRGQTLTVELSFGSPSTSLTVANGGYYQQTAGQWVYLLAADGRSARRIPVHMGRQNPREVEVLAGLRAGDRIITSDYDAFNRVDELKFTTAMP